MERKVKALDQFDKDNKKVQYYSDRKFSDRHESDNDRSYSPGGSYGPDGYGYGSDGSYSPAGYNSGFGGRRRFPGWAKALIIIAVIVVAVIFLTVGCSNVVGKVLGDGSSGEVSTNFGHDYVGVLYIQDTIDEYGTGLYNHQYLLSAIDAMMYDQDNKGIILYVDTPGGSVYASDELYLKIREYQEYTGRPVYSSMQSQATSGGYYISASCDKIFANRNCWTGSIGVTMGTFVDVSGLLEDLGIETETITSGANKSMGSSTEPMTDEQRAIFQSLVDESYNQFVSIVAEGRGMSIASVKALADGRIYSAQQALDNGLVDQIGTFEEAAADMVSSYDLANVQFEHFQPETTTTLSSLLGLLSDQSSASSDSVLTAEAIQELIALNGSFRLSYICEAVN